MHKLRRAGDLTARSQALQQLQEYLDLPEAPLRIECIDISGHQGTGPHGLYCGLRGRDCDEVRISQSTPLPIIKMIWQPCVRAVTRRFSRLAPGSDEDAQTRRRYRPGLLVVDGGEPQVNAAANALAAPDINFIAVWPSPRLEEVWLPGDPDPVILPRRSEGLYLLQRVRDEAHRFAVAYHRQRRAKAARASILDDIPGLGPTRRKLHCSSTLVRCERCARRASRRLPPWESGRSWHAAILGAVAQSGQNGGINVTTGELLGMLSPMSERRIELNPCDRHAGAGRSLLRERRPGGLLSTTCRRNCWTIWWHRSRLAKRPASRGGSRRRGWQSVRHPRGRDRRPARWRQQRSECSFSKPLTKRLFDDSESNRRPSPAAGRRPVLDGLEA